LGTYKEEGPYKSKVFIYDHLGQYINSWEQQYGYCGEFENLNRASASKKKDYFVQDLIWNLRNGEGRFVGGGVYLWTVQVQFESGKSYTVESRMGILRNSKECDQNE
jgi:hypothetical protein